VLQIPETQARDLGIGLPAVVDTRNGTVKGLVSRVDPGAVNGTVTVDITLEGALPRGARPDLSVDGTIEIERLKDVVFVGRPSSGASETDAQLFKVSPDGRSATRATVRLGRASFNAVEIVSGLAPGDRVILSDMDSFDEKDRVRIR
jgi:multidrug efflux pump subunit AcrA (membrane-fusion protein)